MTRTRDDSPAPAPRHRPALHWAALVAAACTWPLLLVGGSVTVYRVGMAVPDWPTTFGVNMFLYDFLDSSWGVYLEHSHRLYGSVVGLACIGLAFGTTLAALRWPTALLMIGATLAAGFLPLTAPAALMPAGLSAFFVGLSCIAAVSLVLAAWFAAVRREAVPALAWFALAAVIGQGVLGGYRVRLNSTDLAFLHGSTAQAFFGLMVVLGVVTGRAWSRHPRAIADTAGLRLLAVLSLALVLSQIVLGAWLRHYGTSVALGLHAAFAAAVALVVAATAWITLRRRPAWPELAPSAHAMAMALGVQMLLGVLAWWLLRPFDGIARPVWPAQAAIRIAHQGAGALLLAAAVVLVLRAFRHLTAPPRPESESPISPASVATPHDLEPVA